MLGARRFLGVTIPPLKHFGPLLVVWGAAMFMLVFIRDLGSSLMFFGALPRAALRRHEPALVRDHRPRAVRARRLVLRARHVGHVHDRVDVWLDPFDPALYDKPGGCYQIAQSLFAQADGGLFGTGFGQALLNLPDGRDASCPRRRPT